MAAVVSSRALTVERESEVQAAPSPSSAYIHLLRAYARAKDLQSGMLIHDHILANGALEEDSSLGDHLVHMYVRCDNFVNALSVFRSLPDPGLLSWNRMISAHVKRRRMKRAIALFQKMQLQGVKPNRKTFVAVLGACGGLDYLKTGKWLHSLAREAGYDSSLVVCTALITMYSDCGALRAASRIFKRMPERDVYAWTAILFAYAQYGESAQAMLLYRKMLLHGILPTVITFAAVLHILGETRDWLQGKKIHLQVTQMGLESDPLVAAALITMFGRCGDVKKARRVFRKVHHPDLSLYNALLTVHSQNRLHWSALELFTYMQEKNVALDRTTVIQALSSCFTPRDLEDGKNIHVSVINHGLEVDTEVDNALVAMYIRCGSLSDAVWMFQRMDRPKLSSWTRLIDGLVEENRCEEALELFRRMELDGKLPNKAAFTGALRACGRLEQGTYLHERVVEAGVDEQDDDNNMVKVALLEMYSRCNCLEAACSVFERITQPDWLSWTRMIEAYVRNGDLEEAKLHFRLMQLLGVRPKRETFSKALMACVCLKDVNELHDCLLERGYDSSLAVGNALLECHMKFGSPGEGDGVLRRMRRKDLTTWNSMLAIYGKQPCRSKAMKLFREMILEGTKPGRVTYSLLFNACMADDGDEEENEQLLKDTRFIHDCTSESWEIQTDPVVVAGLLNMYGRCKSLEDACTLFNRSHHLRTPVWNSMMNAFLENGYPENAFSLFQRMIREGLPPNKTTLVTVLNACAAAETLEEGKLVHAEAVELGAETDPAVGAAVVSMYGSFGCVDEAEKVFRRMIQRTASAWKCMISAYVENGFTAEAAKLVHVLQLEGLAREVDLSFLDELNDLYNLKQKSQVKEQ